MQARDKQMLRLVREEKLGNLTLQLANGKKLSMGALRGSSRVVIVAGTKQQVREGRHLRTGRMQAAAKGVRV